MAPVNSSPTRLITFRLPEATRASLEQLAQDSDRSLAQLVRYAIAYYLTLPAVASTQPKTRGKSQHVSIRLPSATIATVEAEARKRSTTASQILRASVEAWLALGNHDDLGNPIRYEDGGM